MRRRTFMTLAAWAAGVGYGCDKVAQLCERLAYPRRRVTLGPPYDLRAGFRYNLDEVEGLIDPADVPMLRDLVGPGPFTKAEMAEAVRLTNRWAAVPVPPLGDDPPPA